MSTLIYTWLTMPSYTLQQQLASLERRCIEGKLALNPQKVWLKHYEPAKKNKLRFPDHNNFPATIQIAFAHEGYNTNIHNVLRQNSRQFSCRNTCQLCHSFEWHALILTNCRNVHSSLNNFRSRKTFHMYTSCVVLCQHCKSQGQSPADTNIVKAKIHQVNLAQKYGE